MHSRILPGWSTKTHKSLCDDFWLIQSQNCKFWDSVLTQLFLKECFCNWLVWLLTFENGSNKTWEKKEEKSTSRHIDRGQFSENIESLKSHHFDTHPMCEGLLKWKKIKSVYTLHFPNHQLNKILKFSIFHWPKLTEKKTKISTTNKKIPIYLQLYIVIWHMRQGLEYSSGDLIQMSCISSLKIICLI